MANLRRAGLIGPLAIALSVPLLALFDAVSFSLQGTAGPNDQMFISNVRIAKH